MADLDTFLSQIPDEKPVRLFLPVTNADERLLIQCVFKKMQDSHFKLLFKPGSLPVDKIDTKSTILISLDVSGKSVSIESKIVEIPNSQTLELVSLKSISHEQMREYFRVDLAVPVLIKSIVPEEFATPEDNWKLTGTTVDLSGSGLRANFTSSPPRDNQVHLEIALPTPVTNIVKVVATPVRTSQLTEDLWNVAYRFDVIEDDDQDAIIGCCMLAQRRLLRLKVTVKKT